MKTFFATLLVLFGFSCGFVMADDNPVKGLEIKITKILPPGRVTVSVLNRSKSAITLGDESNSWGARNWSVILLRNGQIMTYYRDPHQTTRTRNFRALDVIVPGAQYEVELDLNGGNWCDADRCSLSYEQGIGGKTINIEPNDTIIVIYDLRFTVESGTRAFEDWSGVVVGQRVYLVTP